MFPELYSYFGGVLFVLGYLPGLKEEKMFHVLQTDSVSGEVTVETCFNF